MLLTCLQPFSSSDLNHWATILHLRLLNLFQHPLWIERAKPCLDHPDIIFREFIALCCARSYRRVKFCFPIMFASPRQNRSTSSRYTIFNGPNIPTSQGWSLWEVCEGRQQRIILFSKQNFINSNDSWVPNPLLIKIWGLFPARAFV